MSRGKRVTIVLPVLNEEKNLPLVLAELSRVLTPLPYAWDVCFVDDGSKQPTLDVLRSLAREHKNVRALEFSRNFGHQAALTAGLDHAEGDAVIVMDSDLQHPPSLIPELLARWEDGYDVVYTLRDDTDDAGLGKKVTSGLFYSLFNTFSETRIPPHAADFRLLDRGVVDALKGMRERARFLRGLTRWVGFRQVGVHYTAAARQHGQSSYSLRRMFRLALDAVTSMSTLPLRLCLAAGFAVSGMALAYMFYVVAAYFFSNKAITGWSSLMVASLFLGGVQLTTVGIVGMYVAKVYDEVKQRPLYVLKRHEEPRS